MASRKRKASEIMFGWSFLSGCILKGLHGVPAYRTYQEHSGGEAAGQWSGRRFWAVQASFLARAASAHRPRPSAAAVEISPSHDPVRRLGSPVVNVTCERLRVEYSLVDTTRVETGRHALSREPRTSVRSPVRDLISVSRRSQPLAVKPRTPHQPQHQGR
jgi:hypothetical protein